MHCAFKFINSELPFNLGYTSGSHFYGSDRVETASVKVLHFYSEQQQ